MQPTTDEIFAALRTCRIPEIPVNLGDLGLVHGAGVSALRSAVRENRGFVVYSGLFSAEGLHQFAS